MHPSARTAVAHGRVGVHLDHRHLGDELRRVAAVHIERRRNLRPPWECGVDAQHAPRVRRGHGARTDVKTETLQRGNRGP
jgi:hypothetical protein